jgi:hypothetical protein
MEGVSKQSLSSIHHLGVRIRRVDQHVGLRSTQDVDDGRGEVLATGALHDQEVDLVRDHRLRGQRKECMSRVHGGKHAARRGVGGRECGSGTRAMHVTVISGDR